MSDTPSDLWRAALAEAVGTFALVAFGTGAILVDAQLGVLGSVGVSLVFGLVVMTAVYALSDASGAHINPAVSVGFWVLGAISLQRLVAFIVAQCSAALLASGVVLAVLGGGGGPGGGLGATTLSVGRGEGFVIEVGLTAFLMLVILGVAVGRGRPLPASGLAIGAAVALGALAGGPLTGASMNPARSLGPAVVGGELSSLWLYLLAPVIGAVLAVGLFGLIYPDYRARTPNVSR